MSNTWVTDMRDFEGLFGNDADDASEARKIAEYFGSIVMAATSWWIGIPMASTIRCRRRPGRRPCPGYIQLLRADRPPQIEWQCPCCDDNGVIDGWEGSRWDLSRPEEEDDPEVDVLLTEREHLALRDRGSGDKGIMRIVMGALAAGREIVMSASVEEMEHLAGFVAVEAEREPRQSRRRLLREVERKLKEAVRPPQPGGTTRPDIRRLNDVVDLTDVTGIDIRYGWNGMSPAAPIRATWNLQRLEDGFRGTASFGVGYGGTDEKTRQTIPSLKEEASVVVPETVVAKALRLLARTAVRWGEYTPTCTHTDDYPFFELALRTPTEDFKIFSESQGERNTPWGMELSGDKYTIDTSEPARALDLLKPSLRWDVLEALIERAVGDDGK